jgi:hypothetical protein
MRVSEKQRNVLIGGKKHVERSPLRCGQQVAVG